MKNSNLLFAAVLFTSYLLVSCTGSADNSGTTISVETDDGEKKEIKIESDDMENAVNQMQDALKGLQNGEEVEIVNFRELQGLLDEKLAGMERVSKEGQTSGAMGIKVSTAEAEYEDGSGNKIKLEIIDTGGLGMATMAAAAWASADIDKEDKNGYERTTKIEGYPAYEKFNSRNGKGEIALLIGKRFIVNANGYKQKDLSLLKKAVKALGLRKLEKMG